MSEPGCCALIDFPLHPTRADSPRLRVAFGPPSRWLLAHDLAEVRGVIDAAHAAAVAGAWCVGHVAFEAAPAFDHALTVHAPQADSQPTSQPTSQPVPLAAFAVFDSAPQPWPAITPDGQWQCSPWQDDLPAAEFAQQVAQIQEAIRNGEVYQVNLTSRLSGELQGDPLDWFMALHRGQPQGYAAYLRGGGDSGGGSASGSADSGVDSGASGGADSGVDGIAVGSGEGSGEGRGGGSGAGRAWGIASVSPELFFDWRGGTLTAQPMKGTAARGASVAADDAAARQLLASDKERAENLMIVDLLRNDFARIARIGSVSVPRLFELHALPTAWQMTSTVQAQTLGGITLSDVFAALFPCGSVTGAPKVQAMKSIRALERQPRGVYCGAVGVIAPGGAATFNVPIRTAVFTPHAAAEQGADPRGPWRLSCGIGSGITLDSTVAGEAAEWRTKQRFLARAAQPFKLLESLRLEDGVIWLLDEHLQRLQASAQALGFACDIDAVRSVLATACEVGPRGLYKLRLLLSPQGGVQIEAAPLTPLAPAASPAPPAPGLPDLPDENRRAPVAPGASSTTPLRTVPADGVPRADDAPAESAAELRAGLATSPVESTSDFVRHKTTHRQVYAPFKPAADEFDVLLWNAAGELTEFTLGNVALKLDGNWLTPDVRCGLLPGTYRQALLREGRLVEARLQMDELLRAEGVAFFNSVRGWLPVERAPLQQSAQALLRARTVDQE